MSSLAATPLARVFSGIQPTGIPHLGNYFGALQQWLELANERTVARSRCPALKLPEDKFNPPSVIECDTPIFCIVDVHAYTSPSIRYGAELYRNILDTTASLLAIGLNPQNCILFRQSDVLEHNYLDNVLRNFITTQRLARMTQYKDKASTTFSKGISTGLLTYPVLQAADILLYSANVVPIGEDQRQHIELARDIAENFNSATSSELLTKPEPLYNNSEHARRIKSLRDPDKKMSKSAPNKKSFIEIVDEPDVVVDKVKKALTDSISEVYYDADKRPGVSNLMRLNHLATGESLDQIRENSANMTTAQYKLRLADILIEQFKPVREEFKRIRNDSVYLEEVLTIGKSNAQLMASRIVVQVKRLIGSVAR